MKESALYADTQDTSQLNTQMCHDTSQLTKDTLQLNLVEESRTARLRHCTLHEATSGARSAVGEPLRAPVLAPRLGEAVGSVDRAGALLRLLGQGTEDVPLRQALSVVELLLLLLRELRLLQRGDLRRSNAVCEERRVHLATLLGRRLLGAHRHSRGPHGHAGLHARRNEGAGRRRGKDDEEGAEHDRRCTGERSRPLLELP